MNLSFFVGFGAGLLTREVSSVLQRGLKPVVKNAYKMGYVAYQRTAENLSKVGETFDDVMAEARNEVDDYSTHRGKRKDKKSKEGKQQEDHLETGRNQSKKSEGETHATVH